MTSDIARTPILKDAPRLHVDAKRIVEFYCWSHNVHYCQGMLEVLLPFLFMKSNEGTSTESTNGHGIQEETDPLNQTAMAGGSAHSRLLDVKRVMDA